MLFVEGLATVGRVDEPRTVKSGDIMVTFSICANQWTSNGEKPHWYNCVWYVKDTKRLPRLIPGATVYVRGQWDTEPYVSKDGHNRKGNKLKLGYSSCLQFPQKGKTPSDVQEDPLEDTSTLPEERIAAKSVPDDVFDGKVPEEEKPGTVINIPRMDRPTDKIGGYERPPQV